MPYAHCRSQPKWAVDAVSTVHKPFSVALPASLFTTTVQHLRPSKALGVGPRRRRMDARAGGRGGRGVMRGWVGGLNS